MLVDHGTATDVTVGRVQDQDRDVDGFGQFRERENIVHYVTDACVRLGNAEAERAKGTVQRRGQGVVGVPGVGDQRSPVVATGDAQVVGQLDGALDDVDGTGGDHLGRHGGGQGDIVGGGKVKVNGPGFRGRQQVGEATG